MKRTILALVCILFAANVFPQSTPSVQQITDGVIKSATDYANAIACQNVTIEPGDIAALVPYTSMDARYDAKFAVLWHGDIGCLGGTATTLPNVSIVTVSTGDSYVVDPLQSSPVIDFDSPVNYVDRFVGNTRDSMILEGCAYGENDSNASPSVRVRFTLQVNQKGNWKLVEKETLPSKGTPCDYSYGNEQ